MELDAKIFASRFHDVTAAGEQLVAHVTGEGNVYEVGYAKFLGGGNDEVAAADVVGIDDEIRSRFDDARIFMRFADEEQDIGTGFADTTESFRGTGDTLVDDDDLHERIVRKGCDLGNGGFHFGHEVVGIGEVFDHAAVGRIAILGDQGLGTTQIVFGLGHRTGAYADMEFRRAGSLRAHGKQEDTNTHECS